MNQQCKVCGEPAAGFHFGAFTCEGCKSFFGRSYNNIGSITECKNGGECVINKKNRTACKACRLRKCLLVGMSKSGSRYGRRSNWFKIHCLLQEQQQQQQLQQQQQQQQQPQQQPTQHRYQPSISGQQLTLSQQPGKPTSSPLSIHGQRKEEAHLLGIDDYKNSSSPSISSPESHNSDNSVEVSERRAASAGHSSFRPLHPLQPLHPHVYHSTADIPSLSTEIMNLPLGFSFSGMSLLPPAFLPGSFLFPPYIYQTPHGASHPLVAHQASNALARRSPAMIDENGASAVAATTTTTTMAMTTASATATMSSGTRRPLDDEEECCRSDDDDNNNDNRCGNNQNVQLARESAFTPDHTEHYTKRYYLDAVLKSQRTSTEKSLTPINCDAQPLDGGSPARNPEPEIGCPSPQNNPIDLSMKSITTCASVHPEDQLAEKESSGDEKNPPSRKPAPMDLTTRP